MNKKLLVASALLVTFLLMGPALIAQNDSPDGGSSNSAGSGPFGSATNSSTNTNSLGQTSQSQTPTDNVVDPGGDPSAPIDGGLGLLIAAGAAYGVRRYRDSKKAKNIEEPGLK